VMSVGVDSMVCMQRRCGTAVEREHGHRGRPPIIAHPRRQPDTVTDPRFFSSNSLPRPLQGALAIELDEEVARHLSVLRMQAGDAIILFDGEGGEYHAVVDEIAKRRARVSLQRFEEVERESPLAITLVQALATSDKMDFIVQKGVELGAVAVQPLITERATLKLSGDRAEKRAAHWQAVARAACEQCGRNRVPVVGEPVALTQWLSRPNDSVRVMLHPEAPESLASLPAAHPGKPLAILIGPEGGFSDRETALARDNRVVIARLGPRVLRTETAGLAALAVLNAAAGDLK